LKQLQEQAETVPLFIIELKKVVVEKLKKMIFFYVILVGSINTVLLMLPEPSVLQNQNQV